MTTFYIFIKKSYNKRIFPLFFPYVVFFTFLPYFIVKYKRFALVVRACGASRTLYRCLAFSTSGESYPLFPLDVRRFAPAVLCTSFNHGVLRDAGLFSWDTTNEIGKMASIANRGRGFPHPDFIYVLSGIDSHFCLWNFHWIVYV